MMQDRDEEARAPRPRAVYWQATDNGPAAVELAGLGFAVLAIVPGTKTPFPGGHGAYDASKDASHVEHVFRERYGASVAIETGQSGIAVVDIDRRHDGDAAMRALIEKHGRLPATATVRTPNGWHYYYRAPSVPIRRGNDVLAPGIDVKTGPGHYILCAPSVHPSGERYRWARGPWHRDALPPLPAWIVQLAAPPPEPPPLPVASAPRSSSPVSAIRRARAWLADMPPSVQGENTLGGRNNGSGAMFWAAICMVKGFDLDEDTALDLLREYNRRADPPWSEKALAHKVRDAAHSSKPKGFLLNVPRTGRAA